MLQLEITSPNGSVEIVELELAPGETIHEGETLYLVPKEDGSIDVVRKLEPEA